MSRLGRNTLQLTLASVGQKALAFLYFLLLARTVGAEQTGAYFLALSITTMFSVLTDVGLQPVLIREVAKGREDWKSIFSATLGLKLLFTIITSGLVVGFVSVMGYGWDVRSLVYLALAVMALDAVSLTMYGLLRGVQILRYESLGMFTGQFLTLIVGGVVLFTNQSLALLIVALIVGSTFNAVFSLWMVRKRFGPSVIRVRLPWSLVKPLLRIALPFALAGIFVKVYSYVDTITLSQFFGREEVGIYAVAYKMTYAFQFLPMAFVAALYPAMSELVGKDRERLSSMFDDAMRYMLLLATPIVFGIWSVAEPLILATVGAEFSASVLPLRVLVFVLLFLFLDFPIGSLLNAADRQVLKTTLMGLTMVIIIVANLLLVPQFGPLGAALSACISFGFLLCSGLFFVPRFVSMRWASLLWYLVRVLFVGTLMAAVVTVASAHLHVAVSIVLGAVIYVSGLLALRVIGKQEWTRMRSLVFNR